MSETWLADFDAWLSRMAGQPLPGGVSAAALAAAMGAALSAKAARLTLARQPLADGEQDMLRATLALAEAQCTTLRRLASDDAQAYRAVLAAGEHAEQGSSWRLAWQKATEVPLQMAEACYSLRDRLSAVDRVCWPPVRVDLQVGGWLLDCGVQAGRQAAECNLRVWADGQQAQEFQHRLDALEAKLD
jgi:formiminotetrahydrofolate cyclodeaminase